LVLGSRGLILDGELAADPFCSPWEDLDPEQKIYWKENIVTEIAAVTFESEIPC
jgi:hypothetical protein